MYTLISISLVIALIIYITLSNIKSYNAIEEERRKYNDLRRRVDSLIWNIEHQQEKVKDHITFIMKNHLGRDQNAASRIGNRVSNFLYSRGGK